MMRCTLLVLCRNLMQAETIGLQNFPSGNLFKLCDERVARDM